MNKGKKAAAIAAAVICFLLITVITLISKVAVNINKSMADDVVKSVDKGKTILTKSQLEEAVDNAEERISAAGLPKKLANIRDNEFFKYLAEIAENSDYGYYDDYEKPDIDEEDDYYLYKEYKFYYTETNYVGGPVWTESVTVNHYRNEDTINITFVYDEINGGDKPDEIYIVVDGMAGGKGKLFADEEAELIKRAVMLTGATEAEAEKFTDSFNRKENKREEGTIGNMEYSYSHTSILGIINSDYEIKIK